MQKEYLQTTPILDYTHPSLQQLIAQKGWRELSPYEQVRRVYSYVRDEIPFGYNATDDLSASEVLAEGLGQCNTKSTLLMALLRALGHPCRIHGFTIYKALQKGAIAGLWYRLAPKEILHTWVEVHFEGEWYFLEGVILDRSFLQTLQGLFPDCAGTFCGFGVYTDDFQEPQIDWDRSHTYIQKEGIARDFGLYDSPDDLYREHGQKMSALKKWVYGRYIRHRINANLSRIRQKGKRLGLSREKNPPNLGKYVGKNPEPEL